MMKKALMLLALPFYVLTGIAQVGIGVSGNVNSSARLQVDADNRGFLPPRVALTSTAATSNAITSPATGLLVYNTATAGTSPNNVTPGFYYYDGSKWQRIINQQPDATISFNQNTPTTSGVVFTPDIQNSTDYVYVSSTNNSQWTYNGSAYVTYTPPASTPWMLSGNTTDAGSNKSGSVFRTGSVAIGGTTTAPVTTVASSAQLEVISTTKGFLPPRMTTTQRDAITSPADGLIIFNTTTNRLEIKTTISTVTTWLTLATLSGTETLTNKTLTSPTMTTPALGAATATSINRVAVTQPATSATITIADGKTLTSNNSITLAGTDGTTMTFPASSATLASLSGTETLTNKTISGSSNTISNVSLSTGVTGTLPVANGGTGQTTSSAALNALLPSQTGNAQKILRTTGTDAEWATNVALTSAVIGTFSGSGYSGTSSSRQATGASITLPPGKWSVQINVLATGSNPPNENQATWIRMHLSDATAGEATTDRISGTGVQIVGNLIGPSIYTMVTGNIVINNTGSSNKTYYLVKGQQDNFPGSYSLNFSGLGSSAASENTMVAFPMN